MYWEYSLRSLKIKQIVVGVLGLQVVAVCANRGKGGVCVSLWQNIATMTELGSSSIAIIKWHVSVVKNKRSSGSAG